MPFERIDAKITAKTTVSGQVRYAWVEQIRDAGVYVDAVGARSGTTTIGYAVEKNNADLTPPFFASLYYSAYVEGLMTWEFDAGRSSGGGGGGGITIQEADGAPSYAGVTTLAVHQLDGFQLTQPGGAGTALLRIAAASTSQAGIVNTVSQGFAGRKTLDDGATINDVLWVNVAGNETADFYLSFTAWAPTLWGDPSNPATAGLHASEAYTTITNGGIAINDPGLGNGGLLVGNRVPGTNFCTTLYGRRSITFLINNPTAVMDFEAYQQQSLGTGFLADGLGGFLDTIPGGTIDGLRLSGSTDGRDSVFLAGAYAVIGSYINGTSLPDNSMGVPGSVIGSGPYLGINGQIWPNAVFGGGICISAGYDDGGGNIDGGVW